MINDADKGESNSENTVLTTRQQIKLNLAATLAEDVARAFISNREHKDLPPTIDDPANDKLYRQALNRAEWMIREEENEQNLPTAIYQLFTPRDSMTLVELSKTLSKSKWKGLQEPSSIKKLIELTLNTLRLEKQNQANLDANPDYVRQLISYKVAQITGLFRHDRKQLITAKDEEKIPQNLLKCIQSRPSLPNAITYPFDMTNSKLVLFKDYCLLQLPEDQLRRMTISHKAQHFIRPYPFFLFACVLDDLGLLAEHNGTLYKSRKEVGSINIQSVRQDLSYCNQIDQLSRSTFPEFNAIWDKEYPCDDAL